MQEGTKGREGPDRLHYKGKGRTGGSSCILYADNTTTAKVTGEQWPELEGKLKRTLEPLFKNLKENRVKVNEDKTGLMILGDRKARRRMMRTGGDMEMEMVGKVIKPEESKKSLGLLISDIRKPKLDRPSECNSGNRGNDVEK